MCNYLLRVTVHSGLLLTNGTLLRLHRFSIAVANRHFGLDFTVNVIWDMQI